MSAAAPKSEAPDADGGEWEARAGVSPQPLPALNKPRHLLAAAVVGNQVFVVGGEEGAIDAPNNVERLGDGASAWEEGLTVPTARSGCGACAVGTTVVVVGGVNGGWLFVVEAVDTVGGANPAFPPFPQRTSGCGVVSVGGKVIVTGGYDWKSSFSAVWVLEPGNDPIAPPPQQQQQQQQPPPSWTSLPALSQARYNHGAAAGDGCVFVCGGFDGTDVLDSCEMLRVAPAGEDQGGWEALPPMPTKLQCVGCCFGGGNVFVAGGFPSYQRSVLALSVRERKWTQVAELATGRYGCAAVCVGRRVMVLGGFNNTGQLDGCEAFDF